MTAELTAVGMPSVLVPLPGAPGDHQTANADALVAAGAAVLVPDAELDAARLAAELDALLADPARLAAMGAAARTLGRPDATARFADLVEVWRRRGAACSSRSTSTSREPHADPHRRRRRRGHERDRHRARRAWATASAAPTCASRAVLERLGLLDVTTHVGHAADEPPRRARRGRDLDRHPREQPRGRGRARRGIPVLRRADALRAIVATRTTIAVAGSHGKTTTSSMLALILRAAGWHPSFLIGGDLNEVGTNAVFDDGEWLVVEADESDGTFLELAPDDGDRHHRSMPDHLDHYGDFAALVAAFETFVGPHPGRARALRRRRRSRPRSRRRHPARVVTYGFADDADYRIVDYDGRARRQPVRARAPAASRSAWSSSPCRAGTTRPTRPARPRSRSSSACRSTRSRARSAASVAWPAASSSAASATASPTSTTTRTSRARSTR